MISNGSTFLSDPRGSSQADKGNRGRLTRGEDTAIIVKGGILNRSNSLNECEMSSLSERVGKGREGRGKEGKGRGGVKDCLLRGGKKEWTDYYYCHWQQGIRWKRVKKEVEDGGEVENGLRKEGKGWENHAVSRGGPSEASRLRCGTCRVALTFV